ncbi:MAG: ribbon-helix-helix domain-containing protein [Anaerolineae bacterium]
MAEDTRRINVVFPTRLLEELDETVPSGKRSEVIVEATAAYLRRLKVLAVLKETSGAWSADDHPEMATPEDVNRWLEDLRSSWRRVPMLAEESDSAPDGGSGA